MKTFNFKNYKNCYFNINSYAHNNLCMAISIENNKYGPLFTSTVYLERYFYEPGIICIKNYSENSGMLDLFKKLDLILRHLDSIKCNIYAADTETMELCQINLDKLKEYSKEWNYLNV